MKSKSPPLPPELQEYLAQQARAGGFADSSEYLRALIRQQRAGQAARSDASAPEPAAAAPVTAPPPINADEYDRLRHRLDRLRGDLPHDADRDSRD